MLEEALERKLKKLTFISERNSNNFKLCHLVVVVEKTKGAGIFDEVFELVEIKHDRTKRFNPTGYAIFNENANVIKEDRMRETEAQTACDQVEPIEEEAAIDEDSY